jgi:ABC-2 type transport system ATP-binding protein
MDEPHATETATIDQDGPPALVARALAKRYRRGGPWALRDVDLTVTSRTITALVGPNGAGKSTLIRTFMGFERPTAGGVLVMGIDPEADRKGAIRQVGYVSQATGLYRGLSVGDHLRLATSLRPGFDRGLAEGRLGELGIPLSQRAGDLSGGQQAHVALSVALGTRAPVLLLDEPLASLDPLARHDFLNVLVSEVRGRGATALLSSHIVSDVESACDAIVVLGAGRVMLHAPIAEALATHRLAAGSATGPVARSDTGSVAGSGAGAGDLVATFGRPGGGAVSLLSSTDPSIPVPTLEELVMGYLAASRPGAASDRQEAA